MNNGLGKDSINRTSPDNVLDRWPHQQWVLVVLEATRIHLSITLEVLLHFGYMIHDWGGGRFVDGEMHVTQIELSLGRFIQHRFHFVSRLLFSINIY